MEKRKPIVNARAKVRRNEPCRFCMSGKKFKKCHGAPQPDRVTLVGVDHTAPGEPDSSFVCVAYAGHAQEKPTILVYQKIAALGPIPTVIR